MTKNNAPQDGDDDRGPTPEQLAAEQANSDNGQEQEGVEADPFDDQEEGEEDKTPQFPLEAFPPLFGETVEALMKVYKVDAVLPAMTLLAINSTSFGAGLQTQSNVGPTRGNLYLLAGAVSGTGKSLVQRALQLPLDEAEAAKMAAYKEQELQGETELKVNAARIQRLLRDIAKDKLPAEQARTAQDKLSELAARDAELEDKIEGVPRLSTIDFTSEKMGQLLKASKEQMAVLTAEGGTVLYNILGRYTKGDATDDILLSKCFSGDRHVVDRVSRPSILLQAPCITLGMAVQPDLLYRAYSNERLRVGGFLARCLAVDSRMQVQFEDEETVYSIDPALLTKWAEHIQAMVDSFRFVQTPYTIPVEPAVYKLSSMFHNANVWLIRGELSDIQSFVIRWREQAWRVAINLHVGLHGVDCFKPSRPITAKTFADATQIVGFFAKEQQRILQRSRGEELEKDLVRILELLGLQEAGQIPFRELKRNHGFTEHRLKRLATKYPQKLVIRQSKPEKESRGGRPRFWMGKPGPESNAGFPGFRK
jgi:hypothetical protein